MNLDLTGKVSVVIGAGRGIGKGVVLKLAEDNATVIACEYNEDNLNELVEKVKNDGKNIEGYVMDATNYQQVKDIMNDILTKYRKIDHVIVTVGGHMHRSFMGGYDYEIMKKEVDLNFYSVFNAFSTVLPSMKERQYGRLICFTSTTGEFQGDGVGKSAMMAMVRTIGAEYNKDHITCNAILPGICLTELVEEFYKSQPNGEQLLKDEMEKYTSIGCTTPEDIAKVVEFYLSEDSKFITGQAIVCQ